MPLLKKCPSCGKRFGVSLLRKELLDTQMESEETTSAVLVRMGSGKNAGMGNPVTSPVRVKLERNSYESHFKCSKCGHDWTEKSNTIQRA